MKSKKLIVAIAVALLSFGSTLAQDHQNHKQSASEAKGATYVCPMHADVTGVKGDKCSKCGMALVEKKHKNYTCSMHPEVQSEKPGKCPKCSMTLIEKKNTEEDHSGHKH